MRDSTTAALIRTTRLSLLALRAAVADLDGPHAATALRLTEAEAETLSKATAGLARRLGTAQVEHERPVPGARQRVEIDKVMAMLTTMRDGMANGWCEVCGGAKSAS